jgi:hypothetical protein
MGLQNLFGAPKIPAPPPLPPPVTPAAPNMVDNAGAVAEAKRKAAALAQGGRDSNIATGASGLTSEALTARKMLLGR